MAEVVETLGGLAERVGRWDETTAQALRQAWNRGQRTGELTVASADQLAIRLCGRHPCLVWGDRWWLAATGHSVGTGAAISA